MKIAALIARILLGLVFTGVGISSFFMTSPPPLPGMAGTFNDVFMRSHWSLFVAAAQVVLGVTMLTNRFVPVALIILAAFLYNSFAFHITMLPNGLFGPVIATLLWILVALPYQALFAPIFSARPALPKENEVTTSLS